MFVSELYKKVYILAHLYTAQLNIQGLTPAEKKNLEKNERGGKNRQMDEMDACYHSFKFQWNTTLYFILKWMTTIGSAKK